MAQLPRPTAKPRTKCKMTNWYDPIVLTVTAIRVVVSTIFGELADKRETIAVANAIAPQPFDSHLDYSAATEDFWFDFLADTGDGWNSTYAMARLVSDGSLTPQGSNDKLPRGKILFLGGDEVYPTASREAYDDRFLGPFEEAYAPGGRPQWQRGEQHLFAVPGNHDWYDGLNSFFSLFCRRRVKPAGAIGFDRDGRIVAGRATHQTRSYFAAKLPQGWWIWGTDSQIKGYIDEPQIDFFRHAARHWMDPGSKLILCVGTPSWAYVDEEDPRPEFASFSYLERLAGAETDDQGRPMNHQLKLVLTGDSHHYSRYVDAERHYVTCGGGGAFLHPTHQLKSKRFAWDYPPPGQAYVPGQAYTRSFQIARPSAIQEALYPDRSQSRRLTFWNLAFAFINYRFTIAMAVAYGLFTWLLDFNSRMTAGKSLAASLSSGSVFDAALTYWRLAVVSPAAVMMLLLAWAAYYYAADTASRSRLLRGSLHALAHAVVVTLATCMAIRNLPGVASFWQIVAAAALSALSSATTYGLYLLISILGPRGLHWNEAFSSFAHRGYKCMLRMRISPEGALTIFPIGLTKVPFDRRKTPRSPPLAPHLIEQPVVIQ